MAKQTAKQRTVKRPAKPASRPAPRGAIAKKAATRPAAKASRSGKLATPARSSRPAVVAKAVARTPKSKKVLVPVKPARKSIKPSPLAAKSKPKAVAAKPAVRPPAAVVKASPTPAKPTSGSVAKVAAKPAAAKLAVKPAPSPVKSTPVKPTPGKPASTKASAINGAAVAALVEAKPTGRPMLSQGPFVGSTLTKRGTFAPDKLAAPAPKLPRKRPEPIVAAPPVAPPPPAIATGDKAAKNRAGFGQRDLDVFRDLLFAKRRELTGDMTSMEREALREGSTDLSTLPVHMADQGTDAYEQEFTLGLVEKDRTLLRELNNALAKIQNGSYGICEGTGLPISKPRLEAQPWAKYSIEHARALEKKQMMFRR